MWNIRLHREVQAWLVNLNITDPASADQVTDAIDLLAAHGPSLGRPLVDRLKGSAYHNMKELRPGSAGSTGVRLIFAFDPTREAIFLVGGDKSRQWSKWYKKAIPLADARFTEHLTTLKGEAEHERLC